MDWKNELIMSSLPVRQPALIIGCRIAPPRPVPLVGLSWMTVLMVQAPYNRSLYLRMLRVHFDNGETRIPVEAELYRANVCGGVNMESIRVVQSPRKGPDQPMCQAWARCYVEPYCAELLDPLFIQPAIGHLYEYPYGEFEEVPPGEYLALRCRPPVSMNCSPTFVCYEVECAEEHTVEDVGRIWTGVTERISEPPRLPVSLPAELLPRDLVTPRTERDEMAEFFKRSTHEKRT
jgi:hypothetical protein